MMKQADLLYALVAASLLKEAGTRINLGKGSPWVPSVVTNLARNVGTTLKDWVTPQASSAAGRLLGVKPPPRPFEDVVQGVMAAAEPWRSAIHVPSSGAEAVKMLRPYQPKLEARGRSAAEIGQEVSTLQKPLYSGFPLGGANTEQHNARAVADTNVQRGIQMKLPPRLSAHTDTPWERIPDSRKPGEMTVRRVHPEGPPPTARQAAGYNLPELKGQALPSEGFVPSEAFSSPVSVGRRGYATWQGRGSGPYYQRPKNAEPVFEPVTSSNLPTVTTP